MDLNDRIVTDSALSLDGPVVLILPPDGRMARVARLTASALGSFAAFTVDDIDDLRIGVDELVVTLIEAGDGETLTLRFELVDGEVRVTGETKAGAPAPDSDPERFLLSERILDVVADSHRVEADGEVVRVALAKRPTAG